MSHGRVAQTGYDTNAKLKAMFVYNFTKYIEWPQSYKSGNFVIGVLGESALQAELDKMAATKKAVNQPFEIKRYNSVGEIGNCHMLLIPAGTSAQIEAAVAKSKSNSTLVIGEQEGMAKRGAGINFVIKQNKQKFELNKSNIENRNLKVSSSLLALAIVVE